MSVTVTLSNGNAVHFDDESNGEGETLDRSDYWYTLTDYGVLRIWRLHIDGSTWNENGGEFTETESVMVAYSPSGWAYVKGDKIHPDKR
jgi:hypothetical protein